MSTPVKVVKLKEMSQITGSLLQTSINKTNTICFVD